MTPQVILIGQFEMSSKPEPRLDPFFAPAVVRVSHEALRAFADEAMRRAGMPEAQAALLAQWLVTHDLYGSVHHGCWQLGRYVARLRDSELNPRPNVRIVRQSPTSALVDGDGGLGYFPLHTGTLDAIGKAKAQGIAVAVSRNHGHIGAAGIFARLAAESDLCAFVTSGVQLKLEPGASVLRCAGSSPMAFAAPAGDQPPLVLDCGVMQYIHGRRATHTEQIIQMAPELAEHWMGLGTICQTWGGLLAGLPIDAARADRRFRGASQGAMVLVFDPARFIDLERFKRELDAYALRVRRLEPVPGTEGAYLPGAVELEREQVRRRDGIGLSEGYRQSLEEVADALGMPVPWA